MIGRQRNPLTVLVLMLLTLGIYGLYWIYISFAEVRAHRGVGVSGLVGLLLAMIPVSIFLLPQYVGQMYADRGQARPVSGMTGLWALIPLLGSAVWIFKVQNALNEYWASASAPEPTPEASAVPDA